MRHAGIPGVLRALRIRMQRLLRPVCNIDAAQAGEWSRYHSCETVAVRSAPAHMDDADSHRNSPMDTEGFVLGSHAAPIGLALCH